MTLAFHFLELPNRYPSDGIARIPKYITTARERKPPELTKLLDHVRKGDVGIV